MPSDQLAVSVLEAFMTRLKASLTCCCWLNFRASWKEKNWYSDYHNTLFLLHPSQQLCCSRSTQ